MPYGPYEQISVETREAILTLTLNRPEKLNAFTARIMRQMIGVFTKVNADDVDQRFVSSNTVPRPLAPP
jgi:enoyl-CoA hydratase/carnithine racemase